jgi:hypothetical protein
MAADAQGAGLEPLMLTLSMWSLLVTTFAFFIGLFYIRRYLDEQGIPKGMTRSILILVLASLLSWGAGAVAGWAEAELEAPQAEQSP